MKTTPNGGQTVYFVSNSMTVMEGTVVHWDEPHTWPWGTRQHVRLQLLVGKKERSKDISEIETDPTAMAREVQANHRKKIAACEKRLARLKKSLGKVEAHLPPMERTP